MTYGGWGNFFAENGVQVGVVTAATLVGFPIRGATLTSALANGAIVGIATDAAFNGVKALDTQRAVGQAAIGAGTAAAVLVIAPMIL